MQQYKNNKIEISLKNKCKSEENNLIDFQRVNKNKQRYFLNKINNKNLKIIMI